jgi:hypothetical protein
VVAALRLDRTGGGRGMNSHERGTARRGRQAVRVVLPGHTIHWIQARKAAEDRTGRERGEVIETGESWLVVRLDDGTHRRYGNHDIPRLEQLLEEHGTRVEVQERWAVMWLGSQLISISGGRRR